MCLLKLFGFGTSSWDFQKLLLINRHRKKNLNQKDRVNWRESVIPMESNKESESKCRVKFEGIKNPGINPCAGREKFKAITSDEFRSNNNMGSDGHGQCQSQSQSLALEEKLKLKTKTGFVWNLDDTSALKELQERVNHKNRVMDGLSVPHMLDSSPVERFSHLYPEFLNVYTRSQLRLLEKDFLLTDLDQDGFLNKIEIKYWMEKRLQPITERELRAILCHCDEDKDGALNFREFILMCQHVEYISNSEPFNSNAHLCRKDKLSVCESDQYQIKKPQVEIEAHDLQNINLNDPTQESFNFENNSCLNPSNSKSSSKFKGKVRDTVKYFETQINEVTKDADLDRVQNNELRNNKIRNKLNAHYPTNHREESCEREIHNINFKESNTNEGAEGECPCQSHCECSLPAEVENESQCQSENQIPVERSASSKSRSRSGSRKFSHLKKLHEEGSECESLNDINWTNSKCYTSKEKEANNFNLQCRGVTAKKTSQEKNQNFNENPQCTDDSVVSLPSHLHQANPGKELLEIDELGICKGGSSLISNPDLNQKYIDDDDCTCDVQIIVHAAQENVDVEVELDNDNEENDTTSTGPVIVPTTESETFSVGSRSRSCDRDRDPQPSPHEFESEVAVDALMSSSLASTSPVENKKEVQNHKGERNASLLSQNQISPKSYKKPSWLGNLFLWH